MNTQYLCFVQFCNFPDFICPPPRCSMSIGMDALTNPTGMTADSTSQFLGKHVHFIGVGGCGMSGLARMLLDAGAIVTGSEPKPNGGVFEMTRRGARVSRDQLGELLDAEVDLVVRTAAVPTSNVEYAAACKLGLRQV